MPQLNLDLMENFLFFGFACIIFGFLDDKYFNATKHYVMNNIKLFII